LWHNEAVKEVVQMRRFLFVLTLLLTGIIGLRLAQARLVDTAGIEERQLYLPLIEKPATAVEFRGLWVTRFDWIGEYAPAKIDEIVNNAAYAGFNAILFQARGEADAYYDSSLEPWSRRLTGTLGQDPGWDPLAYLIAQAHSQGIQVHAYINVYPVWENCVTPPDLTDPPHLYHRLAAAHGLTDDKLNGLQWTSASGNPYHCSGYLRASPASVFLDNHLLAVTAELLENYDLDGIHLDHIRYGGDNVSCDPISLCRYHHGVDDCDPVPACELSDDYKDWQRAQVNGTVRKFYQQASAVEPVIALSAAVWPSYVGGYDNYYQDPKAWLQGGYIDMVAPMIYPAVYNCPDNSFWAQQIWTETVSEYLAASNGRHIIPGIGAGYCSFDEIAARIAVGRELGVAGHAIFSYSGLKQSNYFDDLRNGPYALPAIPPPINR
jgi:uncharacterized lipoprotein YddW (UPF0748 family)